MNAKDMQNRVGRYVRGTSVGDEAYQAFIPAPLPPDPPIEMTTIQPLLDKANLALGQLGGVSSLLPDASLFLYMYIRKEAVLSSQIEGTQSTLSDLLSHEDESTPGVPIDDVTEVSCYVAAMDHGLKRLEDLPLSLRLLREIHEKLMTNARGSTKHPGEFRTSQNWLGGTRPGNARFVPPPPQELMNCLGDFEKFLHDKSTGLPVLIKAALAHHQFETIHPFLDGNGRLGRLLITFILCVEEVLQSPMLYLSLYLKTHRDTYYDHLQNLRHTGDWEAWIRFFLEGVIETSEQAFGAAQAIAEMFEQDRGKVENSSNQGSAVLQIYSFMQRHPVASTHSIMNSCGKTPPTVMRSMALLERLGIVQEVTGKYRNKKFVYSRYLDILNKGTEPLGE